MLKLVIGWCILACAAIAVFKLTGSCRGNHCGKCCSGSRNCGSCQVQVSLKKSGKKQKNKSNTPH